MADNNEANYLNFIKYPQNIDFNIFTKQPMENFLSVSAKITALESPFLKLYNVGHIQNFVPSHRIES